MLFYTNPKPYAATFRPIFILRLDRSHVMIKAGNTMLSRVFLIIIRRHQDRRVGIYSEEIGSFMNHLDLLGCESGQTRFGKPLLSAQLANPVDHNFRVVAAPAVDGVHEPADVELHRSLARLLICVRVGARYWNARVGCYPHHT